MYIFKIESRFDERRAWYTGEKLKLAGVSVTADLSNPYAPTDYTGGTNVLIGDLRNRYGYTYMALFNGEPNKPLGDPSVNYLGYPLPITNSSHNGEAEWVRVGYDNKYKAMVSISGGITEAQTGYTGRINSGTAVLCTGVIGSSITIGGISLTGINETPDDFEEAANTKSRQSPEIDVRQKAFTYFHDSNAVVSIAPPTPNNPCFIAGHYTGIWIGLGKTQWTNHKKAINDYSNIEQDNRGNYNLVKKKAGRTYSAEVMLTIDPNGTSWVDPVSGTIYEDYDSTIESLIYYVLQFLGALHGQVNAFYFNNQDLDIKNRPSKIVPLSDSDVIVGVLKSFNISDIGKTAAVLTMAVDSIPNEYETYPNPLDIASVPSGTLGKVDGTVPVITLDIPYTEMTIPPQVMDVTMSVNIDPANATISQQISAALAIPDLCVIELIKPTPESYAIKVSRNGIIKYGSSIVTISWQYWTQQNTVGIYSKNIMINVLEWD